MARIIIKSDGPGGREAELVFDIETGATEIACSCGETLTPARQYSVDDLINEAMYHVDTPH
jgi:hypothetical protein